MSVSQETPKNASKPPEVRREARDRFVFTILRINAALFLDFWLSELLENTLLLFRLLRLWFFVMADISN